jgi:hypothetical protein
MDIELIVVISLLGLAIAISIISAIEPWDCMRTIRETLDESMWNMIIQCWNQKPEYHPSEGGTISILKDCF